MAKLDVKISLAVLSALATQRGLLNAKATDLENQTFILHSMVVANKPDGKPRSAALVAPGDDTPYIKARYINQTTKKAFLIPIRGLLGLDVATVGAGANKKFDKDTTPVEKVADFLMEKATDKDAALLPEKFTVVSVTPREQPSTGRIMYPPYCYAKFSDKVKELREADPNADLTPIYTDIEFMSSLYADEVAPQFANAEPTKSIVITF